MIREQPEVRDPTLLNGLLPGHGADELFPPGEF